MWAKSECEWVRNRLADYNLGRLSVYAMGSSSILRDPSIIVGKTRLYMGETRIYVCESARYAWITGDKSARREDGRYRRHMRRRGYVDVSDAPGILRMKTSTAPTSPGGIKRCTSGDEGLTECITECDSLSYQNCKTYGAQGRRQMADPRYFRLKGIRRGKIGHNMDAPKFEKLIRHLTAPYDTYGKRIVLHIDNATCHSGRSDHWVSPRWYKKGGWRSEGRAEC